MPGFRRKPGLSGVCECVRKDVRDKYSSCRGWWISRGRADYLDPASIEPRRAPWRMLTLGSAVWAPSGELGWRPGIISGLGKNRGDRTAATEPSCT
jgi:hypothetical protein